MKKIKITNTLLEFDNINEIPLIEQELINKARKASINAYAPYSKFKVGAAVLLDTGQIITGNNQENAAYPLGICAERTAISWANSQYPNSNIQCIAISAQKEGELINKPISPCGACRQIILEDEMRHQTEMRIIMDSRNKIIVSENISNLLPLSFSKKHTTI